MHAVGELLGKTISELETMPRSELIDWVAYMLDKNAKADRAARRRR